MPACCAEFIHRWKRDEVYYAKKGLKGSGLLLGEMLTLDNYKLFLKARKVYAERARTKRGNVVILVGNNKRTRYLFRS